MSPETCHAHQQFDVEIKQLLEKSAGLEANMMHVISTLGRLEKSLERRFDKIEKEQENQRVEDTKRDKETAVISTKTNLFWTFLIEKNGIVILGIVAYIVIGRAW